ncbi:MAG: hypothetical protein GX621_04540, partial [Pirellulaceae bacterium]|nr:hypothetical protein [Pirellulaceae bacterium]
GRAKIARPAAKPKRAEVQMTLFGPAEHPLLDELRALDLDRVTPIEALQRIAEWKERLGGDSKADGERGRRRKPEKGEA